MIKNLRRRFIVSAMVSVVIVIVVMIAVINSINYSLINAEADSRIAFLFYTDRAFPKETPSSFPAFAMPPKDMSPEAPFENRFFAVRFDADGNILDINTESIAAVDYDKAAEIASEVYYDITSKPQGYYGSYRYGTTTADGDRILLFLDNSRGLDSFYTFLTTSLAVAAFATAGVFLLVLLFSKRTLKPVAESYAKQKQFITDASHELKTPLSIIGANTDVLEMTQGGSQWTESINNQVGRLSLLTDNLVSLARMDEEKSDLIMTQFSISDAVEESLKPFIELAAQNGMAIESDIERNLSYNGNEDSVRKLVGILLDNAIKYSPPESQILLSLKSAPRGVTLRFQNPVAHIEKGVHDEFFERFYRADSSRSETTGYGVGLSIAKAICQAHKGKISARSDDGASLTIVASL